MFTLFILENQAERAGCVLPVRRWLTAEYLCPMVNVSCTENHIQGHRNELDGILSRMSPLDIQEFVLSDCPELEMPPRIQNFSNVRAIVTRNSAIASWKMDAALTAETNPTLTTLSFVDTNMSAVPPAILHDHMPITLVDLAFSGTNLTKLPDDIDLYWGSLLRLYLEASPGITTIPSAILGMFWVFQVSFINSGIASIPDDTFGNNAFSELHLSGNPLSSLPITMSTSSDFLVTIERTTITEIPAEWMELYTGTDGATIAAGGTTLCERLVNGEPFVAGNDSVAAVWWPETNSWCIDMLRIVCEVVPVNRWFGQAY